jgi:putative Ca2+/H+ antiporter (TMEM165/GDT1 family)
LDGVPRELGDKTQLAVMIQSAVHGRWVVFLDAQPRAVLSTLLGVYLAG